MRLLFLMDPPERLNPPGDTTLAIIEEAERRGHECPRAQVESLSVDGGELFCGGLRVADCDAVLMRKDPPFDAEYFLATLLLERVRGQTLLINDPRGLRDANEKLFIFEFADLYPDTLVTREEARLRAFQAAHGGEMIVKPLDGFAGAGVFHVREGDRNTGAIFETLLGGGWVMAQRYLPSAREGDKRILLVEGEPVGAVLRVPAEAETRANLHVGGQARKTELTEREREICRVLAPRLRADGLIFVGIDVIGDCLTEINVTSPTGAREIERLTGTGPQGALVDWIERNG